MAGKVLWAGALGLWCSVDGQSMAVKGTWRCCQAPCVLRSVGPWRCLQWNVLSVLGGSALSAPRSQRLAAPKSSCKNTKLFPWDSVAIDGRAVLVLPWLTPESPFLFGHLICVGAVKELWRGAAGGCCRSRLVPHVGVSIDLQGEQGREAPKYSWWSLNM